MKKIFLLCVMTIFSLFLKAEDNLFKKGTEFYDKGEYKIALTYFDSLITKKIVSWEIHYNKANCYFKLDSLALAIVEYERALNIDPKNADIIHNLEVCNELIIDEIKDLPTIFYAKWIFNFYNKISIHNWQILIIILVILLLFCLIYSKIKQNAKLKIFINLIITSIIFTICVYFLANTLNKNNFHAIIKENVVNIRSAPSNESSVQFTIHLGTKVKIIDSVENWYNISLSDGKKGWIKNKNLIEI